MAINASDRTLGIVSIWQVLRKLQWELWLIKEIPDRITAGVKPTTPLHIKDARLYAEINAASTSLALVDWLYHTAQAETELERRLKHAIGEFDTSSEKKLLEYLRNANPDINACHQICNANKHFYLRRPDKEFKVMAFDLVIESPDGAIEMSSSSHIMHNRGNPSISTYEMLKSVAGWWESLLVEIKVSDREIFY